MKNASEIIKSIQNQPQFSKLSHYKCIAKVKSLFSPPLQNMVKSAYIKNSTLFFILIHPAGKQEFDNSINSIKTVLNHYMPEECSGVFEDIKAFVTHSPPIKKEQHKIIHVKYKERSDGEFELKVKDEKLLEIFKSIQKSIKCNLKKH